MGRKFKTATDNQEVKNCQTAENSLGRRASVGSQRYYEKNRLCQLITGLKAIIRQTLAFYSETEMSYLCLYIQALYGGLEGSRKVISLLNLFLAFFPFLFY